MRLFNSAVNLHARLMKSRSVLARLLGCSHVPYLTCYIYPTGLRLCSSQTMKSGFLICPCIRTILGRKKFSQYLCFFHKINNTAYIIVKFFT